MTTELAERPTSEIQIAPANPIGQMLQAITAGGITPESASALEKITDLYMRVETENARKAFAVAKAELSGPAAPQSRRQGTCRITMERSGTPLAPYEAIMRQVEPFLSQHGFSICSARSGRQADHGHCTLSTLGGHSESNRFRGAGRDGTAKSSESAG